MYHFLSTLEFLEGRCFLSGGPPGGVGIPGVGDSAGVTHVAASVAWKGVKDFAYQLQNVNLKELGNSKFDLAVIDYSADGSDARRYSAATDRDLDRLTINAHHEPA